ncbi:MAG: hypothetical protein CBC42_00175 [Betaproteobacteria bacterium TMED82]|nr:MAG: hypothetical protein CBC42_00175 [Betaproteobacteria bacterium TMED82]
MNRIFVCFLKTTLICGMFTCKVTFGQVNFSTVEPKQFGYVLGDVFERRIILETPKKYLQDQRDGLVKIERINNWFSITKAEIVESEKSKQQIKISYQVVNVPDKPEMVEVPPIELLLMDNEDKIKLKIPEVLLTVAPVTPLLVSNRGGLAEIQPDEEVGFVLSAIHIERLWIFGFFIIFPLVTLSYCWLPWQLLINKNTFPFSSGRKKILALAKENDKIFWGNGLMIFHDSLNLSLKKSIFLYSIDSDFSEDNRLRSLLPEFKFFMGRSQKYFYEKEGIDFSKGDKIRFIKLFADASSLEKGISR